MFKCSVYFISLLEYSAQNAREIQTQEQPDPLFLADSEGEEQDDGFLG